MTPMTRKPRVYPYPCHTLGTTYFTTTFKGEKIYTYDLDSDWGYWSKPANKITYQAYTTAHPDLVNVTDFDIKTRNARYNNKTVRWSDSAQTWVYGNNKKVNFDNTDEEDTIFSILTPIPGGFEEAEASTSNITPENPKEESSEGSDNTEEPEEPQNPKMTEPKEPQTSQNPATTLPTPQTIARTPHSIPRQTSPTPGQKQTTMSSTTNTKPLGTPPEAFDGKASNTETFWSNLANYYYLNDGMFTNQSKQVLAALTHFKLGTPARDWAHDWANEALAKSPISYSTWAKFKKAFSDHFIPAESALEALAIMHSLHQGNCPFNEWYQEWSTHASHAGVDKSTKVYVLRRNLNLALHNKIIGITPQLTMLKDLVEKACDFDCIYHLYNTPAFHTSGQHLACTQATVTGEEEPTQVNLYQGTLGECPNNFQQGPLLKEECDRCFREKLCLYCSKPRHIAKDCHLKKSNLNRTPGRSNSANQRNSNWQPQVRSATTIEEVHKAPNETPVPVNYIQTWRNELLEGMEHPRLVLLQLKLTLFNYMQYKIK